MARVDKTKKLRPSVLDRLFDDETYNKLDHSQGHHQLLKQLRNSIRRDLELLLNTRFYISKPPDNFPELNRSLLNYGLPDLASVNIIDIDKRNEFSRHLEATLNYFEPRFKSVKVSFIDNFEKSDRTLRFRIDAVIYADPLPEAIVFDSILESATRTVSVKEVSHG